MTLRIWIMVIARSLKSACMQLGMIASLNCYNNNYERIDWLAFHCSIATPDVAWGGH